MSANRTFSLCAAAGSLTISVLSEVKGHVAVAIVFGLLFVGFAVRAAEGRAPPLDGDTPPPRRGPTHAPERPGGPEHEPERQLKRARLKRR